jgi:hypothetical protein
MSKGCRLRSVSTTPESFSENEIRWPAFDTAFISMLTTKLLQNVPQSEISNQGAETKMLMLPERLVNQDEVDGEVIKDVINKLQEGLVGRDEVCILAMLALVSGEHLFLYGPPGTAKSLVAQRLTDLCIGSTYFGSLFLCCSVRFDLVLLIPLHMFWKTECLLSTFTGPEDVFGPVSLAELMGNDIYQRNIGGLCICILRTTAFLSLFCRLFTNL